MIPLQIYDSTKTTIIPLVELWWNYRGGITKIVSESGGRLVAISISWITAEHNPFVYIAPPI
jgi:hypothetical protein